MKIIDKILGGAFPANKRLVTDDNQVDNEIENVIRDAGLTPEATANLTGTASSSGTTITGIGTLFLTELKVGDLFFETSNPIVARRVTNIATNLSLTIASAFPVNFSGVACSIFNVTQLLEAIPLVIPYASPIASGVIELLTNAELKIGTDTLRAATAAAILSLFAASTLNATNSIIRVPINVGGTFVEFIIQTDRSDWGTATTGTETFALTFPNAVLSIIVQDVGGPKTLVGVDDIPYVTTGFNWTSTVNIAHATYIAIGY